MSDKWKCPNCQARRVIFTVHETLVYEPEGEVSLTLGYDDEVNRMAGVVCAGCKQFIEPPEELWGEIEAAYAERG